LAVALFSLGYERVRQGRCAFRSRSVGGSTKAGSEPSAQAGKSEFWFPNAIALVGVYPRFLVGVYPRFLDNIKQETRHAERSEASHLGQEEILRLRKTFAALRPCSSSE